MSTDCDYLEAQAPVRSRRVVDARGAVVRAASGNPELIALGLLDVTAAPYAADPSGLRDATTALQQAIDDARDARLLTYLPAGCYRVSDTLTGIQGVVAHDHWPYGAADAMVEYRSYCYPCTLAGARDGGRARLELAPGAPGFSDTSQPKPLVHFWAREETRQPDTCLADPTRSQLNISFNQQITDLDIDLNGNAGAIAIDHQGAQTSVIEDVAIDATGAFAGLRGLPGSGGGTHGLTVRGGQYGIHARRQDRQRGSQPVPIVSAVRLQGQTVAAILYDGRGPLTVAGADIEGAGVVVDVHDGTPWNGPLNLVDTVFRITSGRPAVVSTHPVVLHQVHCTGAPVLLANEDGTSQLAGAATGWIHVDSWATSGRGHVLINGQPGRVDHVVRDDMPPHAEITGRHRRPAPLPDWRTAGNVRSPPYTAVGDGLTDDTDALQRAIDEHADVFLPPGEYAVSRPLRLHAHTRLFGTNSIHSAIVALRSAPAFHNARQPAPLVETVDDPDATTVLAFLELRLPVCLAGAYALHWRAGRHSAVRNVDFERTLWDPDAPGLFHPLVLIDGHGGGTWYQFQVTSWWSQSPHYRHLLVNGTREPLRIYMLNPEHARCDAQVELRDAHHVDIYACKGEGNYPVVWFNRCTDLRLFGYGGNGAAWPGWPLLRVDGGEDITLANLAPQHVPSAPGKWTALGIAVGPEGSTLLRANDRDIPLSDSLVLWRSLSAEPAR